MLQVGPQIPIDNLKQHFTKAKECNTEANSLHMDLPGGPVVESPLGSGGDMGSIPGLGRCHMQFHMQQLRLSTTTTETGAL